MHSIEDLRNNTQLIDDVNKRVPELWSSFDNIVSYNGRSFSDEDIDNSVNEVFKSCIDIISLVPLMISFVDIPQVVRGRPNYAGEIFNKQSQLSYNTEFPDRIAFGRFNRKSEPLFYASLPTESKNVDYVLSCALECCKELTAEKRNYKFQDITVGGWVVNDPIPAINLCFNDGHLNENPSLQNAVTKHLNLIRECFSPEANQFITSFLYYFSDLSGTLAKNDYHYFATAALFNAIRYYYSEVRKEPEFGLIYPGAMSEKKGLNIVLTREAVDKHLTLDKVVMFRYCPVYNGATDCLAEPCSDLVYPDVAGNFKITGYKLPGNA